MEAVFLPGRAVTVQISGRVVKSEVNLRRNPLGQMDFHHVNEILSGDLAIVRTKASRNGEYTQNQLSFSSNVKDLSLFFFRTYLSSNFLGLKKNYTLIVTL